MPISLINVDYFLDLTQDKPKPLSEFLLREVGYVTEWYISAKESLCCDLVAVFSFILHNHSNGTINFWIFCQIISRELNNLFRMFYNKGRKISIPMW